MEITKQILSEKLVCPRTRQPLVASDDGRSLSTRDGKERYEVLENGVPILVADKEKANRYVREAPQMVSEYEASDGSKKDTFFNRRKARLNQDYRTAASLRAFESLFQDLPADALCLSIGGGPTRPHPDLTNVNIGPFPDVDVVADAHVLPYADDCVDVVYCEAVMEHLRHPGRAAAEMRRVMKPNGKAFIATPFLQAYHGYPHHYRNYTLTGHQRLFEDAGFRMLEAGVCVGPVYTMVNLFSVFLHLNAPRLLKKPLTMAWDLAGMAIRPLDKKLAKRENAFLLASTTYVLIKK